MDIENLDDILDEFDDDDFNGFNADLAPKENINQKYFDCLKTVFGHSNFRAMQWKVISSVMNDKRDNCTVMATGYGKSLCYQFPSVYLDTVTVVVSPLISLMEDQVLSLTVSNIKACLLGTAQKNKNIIEDVFNFEYNLVYVTPEFLTGDYGNEFLRKLSSRLTLIAIDEAHCISKWGHDFRSAFRSLGNIRRIVPNVPILAMTATATDKVRKDIIKSLHLQNTQELCTGFDRPNLEFSVREKSKFGVWNDIGVIIQSVRIGSIIVYCLTRSVTEEISEILNNHNVKSTCYHAGLTINQRKTVHEEFVRDKVQVIVATIAFGMGIDKPDVRMVIHYGASKDIESYYQEVGRAGRDGMPAKCFMFYSNADWRTHEFLGGVKTLSEDVLRNRKELAFKMKEYVGTLGCRREFIIKYFEGTTENLQKRIKSCCDNCRNNAATAGEKLSDKYEDLSDDGLYDFSKDAEHFFRTIEVFNGYKGLTTLLLFLRGSKRQTLGERYFSHPLFGCGKERTEEWWKSFSIMMEINFYVHKKQLQLNNKFGGGGNKSFKPVMSVYELTDKARNWLSNTTKKPILLKPDKIMYKFLKKKKTAFLYDTTNQASIARSSTAKLSNINVNKPVDEFKDLLKLLLTVRGNIASTLDIMPYMIISNKALHQLTQKRPVTLDELKEAKLDGLSDVKATKFGPAFIKAILQFKNFLPPDNNLQDTSKKTLKDYILQCPMNDSKPPTETLLRTYDLFSSGKSIREICQIRSLAESTVSNYMNDLIRLGFISTKKDLRRLGLVDYNFHIIENVLPQDLSTVKLKDIKDKCPPTITYDMIKYTLSYNKLREHCKMNKIPFVEQQEQNVENKCTNNGKQIENPKDSPSTSTIIKQINEIEKNKNNLPMPDKNIEKILLNSDDDDNNDDVEFDFGYLDDQVEKFNNSILSVQSTTKSLSQSSTSANVADKTNSIEMKSSQGNYSQNDDNDDVNKMELDLLIEDIKNDEIYNSGKSQESINDENENNLTEKNEIVKSSKKRKITLKKEKNLIYLDDSDSSDDNKTSEIPQKKKFPDWMKNVKK